LTFWQGDVAQVARELTAQGLRFARGPNQDAKGAGAALDDPDGHMLHFINLVRLRPKQPA